MAVSVTLNDIEEYSLRSIAVLGGNMHSQNGKRNTAKRCTEYSHYICSAVGIGKPHIDLVLIWRRTYSIDNEQLNYIFFDSKPVNSGTKRA